MSQVFGTYVKLAGNIIFILPFSGSRLSKEKYKYNYVLDPSLGIFQELWAILWIPPEDTTVIKITKLKHL